MTRVDPLRAFLALLLCLLPAMPAQAGDAEDLGEFRAFVRDFVSEDGRVIDRGQGDMSHSEGQALTMLLAVAHDDQETFARVWNWTVKNLAVRPDGLLAWSWGQRLPGRWEVMDLNNASDGDLLAAWALVAAGNKWDQKEYLEQGLALAKAVKDHVVMERDGRLCLLPGYQGFTRQGGVVLNPSYFVFPAFRAMAEAQDRAFWEKLRTDSLFLLSACRTSSLGLPPDWFVWDGKLAGPWEDRGLVYGYEAVRIPLYLSLDRNLDALPGVEGLLDLAVGLGRVPLSVDLARDSVSLLEAPAGFQAILARAAADRNRTAQSEALWISAAVRLEQDAQDYYSRVLYLLARMEEAP